VRFDADKVVALKLHIAARRLEIRLADARGAERIVSLPVPAAVELANFILDVCAFLKGLTPGARGSRRN
jgi:hypothetical protein